MKAKVKEYEINLDLVSGANLEILLFSNTEHKWIFKHRFMSIEKREIGKEPALVNDTTLFVDYDCGVPQECNLSMNIIRPDKRGKQYYLGVDISKGSHLFAEFVYEKQCDLYRLKTIDLGIHGKIDLDAQKDGLLKPTDFPFPVKDRIENEFGVYKVPFLDNNGKEAFFEFPKNYCRNQ